MEETEKQVDVPNKKRSKRSAKKVVEKTRVKNISSQNWMAFSATLAPGETFKPGKAQLKETRAMSKIARAVELGKLEWV